MYYNQSSARVFWVSFLTSLLVSAIVSFTIVYFVPDLLGDKNSDMVEVPNVEKLDLQTAQMIMDRNNLSLVIAERKSDEIVEKDRIIYQDPASGAEVKKGDIVRVVVSDGIPSEPEQEKEEIIVPDVTGFEINQARVFLSEKGLSVGKVEERISDQPEGEVIEITPEPGKKITEDIAIKLVVSSGPGKVEVPNIKRRSISQARQILEQNGLELGNINYTTSPEYPFDIIISQEPEVGYTVSRGTKVNVTINREAQ